MDGVSDLENMMNDTQVLLTRNQEILEQVKIVSVVQKTNKFKKKLNINKKHSENRNKMT